MSYYNYIPPWDQLPEDLLLLISDRLGFNPADYVRFGAVCKSWHGVATKENYPLSRRMPWLILAEDEKNDNDIPNSTSRRLYIHSDDDDETYAIHLPEARGRKCVGSTGGWLVTVGTDLKIQLLNPFTRVQIPLPSANELDGYIYRAWKTREHTRNTFIDKVCLSSNPWNLTEAKKKKNAEFLTALVIYEGGDKLPFSILGDRSWTGVAVDEYWQPIMDAVFYKGRFYVVACHGHVLVLDSGRHQLDYITSVPVPTCPKMCHVYLVESVGDLLVVVRAKGFDDDYYSATETFSVYKLATSMRRWQWWEAVTDLGDRSVFVGLNNSFSVAATEMRGCRENCVYFTDDEMFRGELCCRFGGDMGVFSLEDGSIEPHFRGKSLSKYSPPLWMPHFLWWQQ